MAAINSSFAGNAVFAGGSRPWRTSFLATAQEWEACEPGEAALQQMDSGAAWRSRHGDPAAQHESDCRTHAKAGGASANKPSSSERIKWRRMMEVLTYLRNETPRRIVCSALLTLGHRYLLHEHSNPYGNMRRIAEFIRLSHPVAAHPKGNRPRESERAAPEVTVDRVPPPYR